MLIAKTSYVYRIIDVDSTIKDLDSNTFKEI